MRRESFFVVIAVGLSLAVVVFSQPLLACLEEPEVIYLEGWEEWPVGVPEAGQVLTV